MIEVMRRFREDAGRAGEPFETVIPVRQLDQVDAVRRLEERGMTSALFGFTDYQMPLQDKLKMMDAFANYLMPALVS